MPTNMSLSLKKAQIDQLYNSVKADPWMMENFNKLPLESLFDYVKDTYQTGEGQAEEIVKMLDREFNEQQGNLVLSARKPEGEVVVELTNRVAQRTITVPATDDNPVAQTVTLPEQEEEVKAEDKVVLTPKSPAAKEQVLDQAVNDGQATRQEQLYNSMKAMKVVMDDFVVAMYGLKLADDKMGKLMEAVIDKASDLAAEQTADTVKQLASPFIPG